MKTIEIEHIVITPVSFKRELYLARQALLLTPNQRLEAIKQKIDDVLPQQAGFDDPQNFDRFGRSFNSPVIGESAAYRLVHQSGHSTCA